MSQATLTLIGLYNYDNTLFENLSFPTGIDTETATNVILAESGEFEVLYPDIDFLKSYIGVISKKWYRTFDKWYTALQLEYNPIYNYDRFENWTDTGTDTGTVNKTGSDTGTITTDNDTTSRETSSASGTTNTFVNAYDNNTLVQDGQSQSTQDASNSGSGTNDTTETRDLGNTDNETRNLATSGEHTGHMYGNIGVTTSQQMLESELDLAQWNLYQHIADIFVKELCIPIYG